MVALVCLVLCAGGRPVGADEPPASLDAVLSTGGAEIVGVRWRWGLNALHALIGAEPAYAAVKAEALKGLDAWDAGKLADAQVAFDKALDALLLAPTTFADVDVVLGGILFGASRAAWERRVKEASDVLSFSQPHNPADYDKWVLVRGAEHEKEGRYARARALYLKGLFFLDIEAEKDADFDEAFCKDREVQTRLALARALADGRAPPSDVISQLDRVVSHLDHLGSKEDRKNARDTAQALFERERRRIAIAVRGQLLKAQVAWSDARRWQADGNAAAYRTLLERACNWVAWGPLIDLRAAELAMLLGRGYTLTLEAHLLSGQLHHYLFNLLLPGARSANRSTNEGRDQVLDTLAAVQKARDAYGQVIAIDPKHCDARLAVAELLVMEHGTGASPDIAAQVKTQVTVVLEACGGDPEAQYQGALILINAGLSGKEAPLRRFLELAPDDPRAPDVKKLLEATP